MERIVLKTISDIRSLKVQGARNIAALALDALGHVAKKKGFGREFFEAANALEGSRKTAVPLFNAIEIAKSAKTLESIKELRRFLDFSAEKAAENGARLINKNVVILTHCHSSEAVLSMILAKKQGKKFRAIVTETRPKLQGLKTAKALLSAKIPVEYIADSAAGVYMKYAGIVLLGCDAIRQEGIYNKIGTYLIALAARENNVPVYFVADSLKIDRRKSIEIEMRPEEEIISPKLLKGAKIMNPAFDCTPWTLVCGIVTERGIFNAKEALKSFEFAKSERDDFQELERIEFVKTALRVVNIIK